MSSSTLLFSQVEGLSVAANYDYSYNKVNHRAYRMENKTILVRFHQEFPTENRTKTILSASMALTYQEAGKIFADGVYVPPNNYVRISVDFGKVVNVFKKGLFESNLICGAGFYRDIGKSPWSSNLLNFRIAPKAEVLFSKRFYILVSPYKTLFPMSPTSIDLEAGIKININDPILFRKRR